ncbi:MAG TPA: hypothetical protein VFH78_10645 [Candidatus Thermoplasmatota archaeon]|nr:hypothetical protein [Candidatus Thermoplasmatota archaeon]
MDLLASGILLLLAGGSLAMLGLPFLVAPGWATITAGAVLVTADLAIGPTGTA